MPILLSFCCQIIERSQPISFSLVDVHISRPCSRTHHYMRGLTRLVHPWNLRRSDMKSWLKCSPTYIRMNARSLWTTWWSYLRQLISLELRGWSLCVSRPSSTTSMLTMQLQSCMQVISTTQQDYARRQWSLSSIISTASPSLQDLSNLHALTLNSLLRYSRTESEADLTKPYRIDPND